MPIILSRQSSFGYWINVCTRDAGKEISVSMHFSPDKLTEMPDLDSFDSLMTIPRDANALQTIDNASLYVQAMACGILFVEDVRPDGLGMNALVLGLGGGVLLSGLMKACPKMQITAIELDPSVAKIAREFFGLPDVCNVIIGDARTELRTTGRYHAIYIDLCGEQPLDVSDMMMELDGHLEEGGVVVCNTWYHENTGTKIQKAMREHFDHVIYLKDGTNRVIIAHSRKGCFDKQTCMSVAHASDAILNSNMAQFVNARFQSVGK